MKGFFEIHELKPAPKKVIDFGCDTCGLYKKCATPKMEPTGKGRTKIMILGEKPSSIDDEYGEHFTGEHGSILDRLLRGIDFSLNSDFWNNSVINCTTPGKIEDINVKSCHSRIERQIAQLNPNVIVPLGLTAVKGLLNHADIISDLQMIDFIGKAIPDQKYKRWIVPTWGFFDLNFHSDSDYNNQHDPVMIKQMQNAFELAFDLSSSIEPFPIYNYKKHIHPIYDVKESIRILNTVAKSGAVTSFDLETSGLKPHKRGHFIYTISIANDEEAWAFPFFDDKDFKIALKNYLETDSLKVGSNIKFDATWIHFFEKYRPRGMRWDTLIATHCEKNNQTRTSLKVETYFKFGVPDYASSIKKFLETSKDNIEGANAKNNIQKAGLEDVLIYNGADTWFDIKLYREQLKVLNQHQQNGVEFFTETSHTLSEIESTGIVFYEERAREVEKELEDIIKQKQEGIFKLKEVEKFENITGAPFRPSADADISKVLFDILKHESIKKTKTGDSVDESVLEAIDIPFTRMVLEWKKLSKLLGTYIRGFYRECVDGLIHAFFNLTRVITFRTSSNSPNFQNIPKRDKETASIIRKLIRPFPGQKLAEYDYKGVEVSVSACYNKDPNLIAYVSDLTKDMHRDVGMLLFFREAKELTKDERFVAKNGFVFAEFYGDYYVPVSRNIWSMIGPETRKHLKQNGILNLDEFTEHVKRIESDFWERRFPVYAKWKKDFYKKYQEKGYVDLYTGFRCYGPMDRNKVVNYPIQGSACHCLLWSLNKVNDEIKKKGMKSRIMGQIHDSIIVSVEPSEEKELDYLIWYYGTQKIKEYWPWIIVPLMIEKSITNVDESWNDIKEFGFVKGESA